MKKKETTTPENSQKQKQEHENQHSQNDKMSGKNTKKEKKVDENTDKAASKKNRKSRSDAKTEKDIETLKAQLSEANDKYLRLYSEFDNFRKRTARERLEFAKTASAEVIVDLLPVLDDCERAKKSLDESKDIEAIREGMELIYNKLRNILQQKGLEEMTSIGEVFNTDHHEAVTNIPAPTDEQKGQIIDELEKGYFLNGKVIRYAKVVVGQ